MTRLLGAFRHMPPVDRAALEGVLLRVSEMVCELPWIQEMGHQPAHRRRERRDCGRRAHRDRQPAATGQPLLAHGDPSVPGAPRLRMAGKRRGHRHGPPDRSGGRGDRTGVRARLVSREQILSLHGHPGGSRLWMLARFTQIDYDREMAFIAVVPVEAAKDGKAGARAEREIGVCRYVTNPDGETCEFALAVLDAWQRRGSASG